MTALERGQEMMYIKMSELPPLALKFARKLCSEVGMCMEVYLTAYAAYAQCVEGLPCDDEAYMVSPSHREWFKENQEVSR